jgi:hypothetical protein
VKEKLHALHIRHYAPPGDHIRLETDEPRLLDLASRLWAPASSDSSSDVIEIEIVRSAPSPGDFGGYEDFLEGARADGAAAPGSPRRNAAPATLEERLRWKHEAAEFRCEVPGVLEVRIDLAGAGIRAALAPGLSLSLSKKSSSPSLRSFLARTLLEAPVAVLLARRGWRALHAGAVTGPKGAVVVRGDSGAGKSTLVAAAHAAGLDVLGDESLLVSRADPDDLASSVRELTLREDSATLLRLLSRTRPAFSGGEEKRRVDLFANARPEARVAHRLTTLLLGPRTPGPARIVALSPEEFLEEFQKGEIPQEHVTDGSRDLAHAWASAGGARLDGAQDLEGAIELLKGILR